MRPIRSGLRGKGHARAHGRGDAVINLLATTLGANAFMLTGDATYRDWVIDIEVRMARTEAERPPATSVVRRHRRTPKRQDDR